VVYEQVFATDLTFVTLNVGIEPDALLEPDAVLPEPVVPEPVVPVPVVPEPVVPEPVVPEPVVPAVPLVPAVLPDVEPVEPELVMLPELESIVPVTSTF
jgi:hypothetical protein